MLAMQDQLSPAASVSLIAAFRIKLQPSVVPCRALPMAAASCRNGKIVVFSGYKAQQVPMRLIVTIGDVGGQKVLNAMAEPLLVPIGVSGGGFGPLTVPVSDQLLMHVFVCCCLHQNYFCAERNPCLALPCFAHVHDDQSMTQFASTACDVLSSALAMYVCMLTWCSNAGHGCQNKEAAHSAS